MTWLAFDPKAEGYCPPRMTDKQMRSLEETIGRSKDATDLAKRAIIWALRQTDNLSRPVALSIPGSLHAELAQQMSHGAHDMVSSNGSTHLGTFLHGMGTEMYLMHHMGIMAPKTTPRRMARGGYTIWWAFRFYDRQVTVLKPNLAEILAVRLRRAA